MKKVFACFLFLVAGLSAVRADDGGKTFLERFYQEGAECWFDNGFLKRYLTQNALKYLHDSYDYDDDSGEGLAMWLFYQEGGWDIGDFKEFLVTKVKDNTYRVTCHADFNEDTYEYTVVFGLVRDGNTWKIDTIKPGKGDIIVSDPGIQNGSRWNIGSCDYTAKVNFDRTITFNAMAEGEELMFRLTPNYSKEDEYILSDEPAADGTNPFSDTPRVKFIDKYGTKLLCLYDQSGLLQHVLDGKTRLNGEQEAKSKWDIQLSGYYTDRYGDTLQISSGVIYEKGVARATYEHIPFNGTITGVMRISGNTHLDGLWEAVVTLDGLTLYEVAEDEYGIYHRKGNKEILTWARNDFPRFNYTWVILLNDGQFRRLKKSTLRIMRNEILARNGYRFQSKDLEEYFSKWSWYRPIESNDDVKPNETEMLNLALIKAEEAKPDDERYVKEE